MSARRVAWLLAAGVLVIAFAIWLSSQRHLERATQAGDLVLPGLEHSVNAVTQLSVRKGDGTAATIQRSGEAWSVGERVIEPEFRIGIHRQQRRREQALRRARDTHVA